MGRPNYIVAEAFATGRKQIGPARLPAMHQRELHPPFVDHRHFATRRRVDNAHGGPFRQREVTVKNNDAILYATGNFHDGIFWRGGVQFKTTLSNGQGVQIAVCDAGCRVGPACEGTSKRRPTSSALSFAPVRWRTPSAGGPSAARRRLCAWYTPDRGLVPPYDPSSAKSDVHPGDAPRQRNGIHDGGQQPPECLISAARARSA